MKLSHAGLFALAILLSSACTPPIPTSTPTPRPPTNTPQLVITVNVTVNPADIVQVPTWTPRPSPTRRPTSAPLPSATGLPTITDIPSKTPAGGRVGVETTDGLLTILLTTNDLNTALAEQAKTVAFSSQFSSAPTANFSPNLVRLSVNFNNFTREGVTADVALTMRALSDDLIINIASANSSTGGVLNEGQIATVSQILGEAAKVAVFRAGQRIEQNLYRYKVVAVQIQPDSILVTIKLTTATPTYTPSVTNTPSRTHTPTQTARPK